MSVPAKRNVRVAADIRTSDFARRVIKSGESVEPRDAGRAGEDDTASSLDRAAIIAGRPGSRGGRAKT